MREPRILGAVAGAITGLLFTACAAAPAARPGPANPPLTLIADDDPRARAGEPVEVRLAPGTLMEDAAQEMFARAAQLGFTTVSSLETHAQVAVGAQVFECTVRLGSPAEIAAWQASTPGNPAIEAELARRVTLTPILCNPDGIKPGSSRAGGFGGGAMIPSPTQRVQEQGALGRRSCSVGRTTHTMYEFERRAALGEPRWPAVGLALPSGFAASAPRCTQVASAPLVHRLVAVVHKP